jgi:CBS domain containing-hemolysin-like protein
MDSFLELSPWLFAMIALMACSGFFSASEAALFYLRPSDRQAMKSGSAGDRAANELMDRPDRLLSAILFWNLVINIAFFTISSICAIRIEERLGQSSAILFAIVSLLAIIFFSEMMPKNVAVLQPRKLASAFSIPLSFAIKVVSPIMPFLRSVNTISQRLIWPGFEPESYMDVDDLESVIEHSADNVAMLKQEETVLQNIVQLSNIRVDEWMRPRTQFETFQPPVSREYLVKHGIPAGGYLLVTESDSLEIEKAIRLDNLFELPDENIEKLGESVLYLPWCSTVAEAFEKMSHRNREVTVVVNEFGDTIGILTIEDILESVFSYSPSRIQRVLDMEPIVEIEPGRWRVPGMMSLRRLSRHLDAEIPETSCVTVGGIVQETLQRLGKTGDQCKWGPFELSIVEAGQRGHMLIELSILNEEDSEPTEDNE